jgi:molybdopterin-guanine dinucleotide biosynthesis protein A
VYGKACLPAMERRLRAGRLKVSGFFDEVRVLRIPEAEIARVVDPAVVFMNLNTPEDVVRARSLWGAPIPSPAAQRPRAEWTD